MLEPKTTWTRVNGSDKRMQRKGMRQHEKKRCASEGFDVANTCFGLEKLLKLQGDG